MDHGKRRKVRIFRYLMVVALVFLAFCFLGSNRPAVASDIKVVKGIVGTVTGNLIYLNGRSVDLTGVPVRNASGKELSLADITPGKKVGLCYRRGRVSSVLVFEPMVE
jgi:hypothetical protein